MENLFSVKQIIWKRGNSLFSCYTEEQVIKREAAIIVPLLMAALISAPAPAEKNITRFIALLCNTSFICGSSSLFAVRLSRVHVDVSRIHLVFSSFRSKSIFLFAYKCFWQPFMHGSSGTFDDNIYGETSSRWFTHYKTVTAYLMSASLSTVCNVINVLYQSRER